MAVTGTFLHNYLVKLLLKNMSDNTGDYSSKSGWDTSIPFEKKEISNLSTLLNEGFNFDSPLRKETPIPRKDVMLIHSCFTSEECVKLIDAAESYGYGRTNFPKKYRGNLRLILDDPSFGDALWRRIRPLIPLSFSASKVLSRGSIPNTLRRLLCQKQ